MQGLQVSSNCSAVPIEVRLAHARLMADCKDDLTTLTVRDDAHRVEYPFTAGKRDGVIEDPEVVGGREVHAHTPHRGLDDPVVAGLLDGALGQTRRPCREVSRVSGVGVHSLCACGNGDADVARGWHGWRP